MCINAVPDGCAPNHGSKGPGGRAWSRQVPRRVGLGCAKLQGREAPSTTNQPSKPTAIPEGAGWDRSSCAGGSGSITWGEMNHKPVNITELKRHVKTSLRWKVGNQLKRHKSKWRMYVGGKQAEDWLAKSPGCIGSEQTCTCTIHIHCQCAQPGTPRHGLLVLCWSVFQGRTPSCSMWFKSPPTLCLKSERLWKLCCKTNVCNQVAFSDNAGLIPT